MLRVVRGVCPVLAGVRAWAKEPAGNDIALVVLVLVFLVATVRSINMGATAFGAGPEEVVAGFPASLFVILVGATYLFALAKNTGPVDWMVQASVPAVRGRLRSSPGRCSPSAP